MSATICHEELKDISAEKKPRELGSEAEVSPVLARLIEEVRNEKAVGPLAYNRMHNRHNRSR